MVIRVLDNDSDVDGDKLTISQIDGKDVTVGKPIDVANGTATLNADGTITFTPDADYNGPAKFTYTATDGRTPVMGNVDVTVTPVNDAPIAIQLVYRVETPQWISVEYINGGVDPETREFSPGSVLSFLNTQSAWEHARALDKPLRFSFGRADREYKDRWCHRVPVYQI